MKYLIDSLQSYENGYGDALCPTRVDASHTFMGEGELTKAVTLQDIHVLMSAVEVASLNNNIGYHQHSPTGGGVHTLVPLSSSSSVFLPPVFLSSAFLPSVISPSAYQVGPGQVASHNTAAPTTAIAVEGLAATPASGGPAMDVDSLTTVDKKNQSARLPIAGVYIPDLPRGKGSWKTAVVQWEQGDLEKGVMALKDWPKEYYTGVMKDKVSTKWRNRRLIAEEYQRYVFRKKCMNIPLTHILFRLRRDDAAFEALYGNVKGPAAVIKAIRQNLQSLGLGKKSPSLGCSSSEEEPDHEMDSDKSV
jgi:hypothetical protein